jgi:hypothetical protein
MIEIQKKEGQERTKERDETGHEPERAEKSPPVII